MKGKDTKIQALPLASSLVLSKCLKRVECVVAPSARVEVLLIFLLVFLVVVSLNLRDAAGDGRKGKTWEKSEDTGFQPRGPFDCIK